MVINLYDCAIFLVATLFFYKMTYDDKGLKIKSFLKLSYVNKYVVDKQTLEHYKIFIIIWVAVRFVFNSITLVLFIKDVYIILKFTQEYSYYKILYLFFYTIILLLWLYSLFVIVLSHIRYQKIKSIII